MSQQFEKWLKDNWVEDKNREYGEKEKDRLRKEIKKTIVSVMELYKDDTICQCDVCILGYLRRNNKETITSLASIGMQYLLGENFNGASANYYLSFVKSMEDGEI